MESVPDGACLHPAVGRERAGGRRDRTVCRELASRLAASSPRPKQRRRRGTPGSEPGGEDDTRATQDTRIRPRPAVTLVPLLPSGPQGNQSLLCATPGTALHPRTSSGTESKEKTSPQPWCRASREAGVPHADVWLIREQGTQWSCWAASALLGAVQRAPQPTPRRKEGQDGAESRGCQGCCRPTLQVTTVPTLGRSWDSVSLTTDTTGSCRAAETRVSSGRSPEQAPSEPCSPAGEGAAQRWRPAAGSGEGRRKPRRCSPRRPRSSSPGSRPARRR